jgi:hypothetical protein
MTPVAEASSSTTVSGRRDVKALVAAKREVFPALWLLVLTQRQ